MKNGRLDWRRGHQPRVRGVARPKPRRTDSPASISETLRKPLLRGWIQRRLLLDELLPGGTQFVALDVVDATVAIAIKAGEHLLAAGLRLGAVLFARGPGLGIFGIVQPAVVIVIEALENLGALLSAHLAEAGLVAVLAPTLPHLGAGGLAFSGVDLPVAIAVEAFDHFGVARAVGCMDGGRLGAGEDGNGE